MFLRFFPVLCIYVLSQLTDIRTVQRGLVYMSMVWPHAIPLKALKRRRVLLSNVINIGTPYLLELLSDLDKAKNCYA